MSIPILGIGVGEALVILVLTLLLVGPKRFPEIMRQVGHWYRIARGFTTEVMKDVRAAVDEIEQEVNTEAEDLRSVRELADVRKEVVRDFQDAKKEADEAARETEEATRAASDAANEGLGNGRQEDRGTAARRRQTAASRAIGRSARPGASRGSATSNAGGRNAKAGPVPQPDAPEDAPRIDEPAPVSAPPDEIDPFDALGARQAAAARESAQRSDSNHGTDSR